MHFHIQDQTEGHRPLPGEWPDFEESSTLTGSTNTPESNYRLLVTAEAVRQLHEHIGLGRDESWNRIEQGGILMGQLFEDKKRGVIFAQVTHVIPGQPISADGVHVQLDYSAWSDMLNRASKEAPRNAVVVGWYHTHPGKLKVFMSAADVVIQQQLFHEPWLFSLVINPQKGDFGVWHGVDTLPCSGWLLCPPAAVPGGDALARLGQPRTMTLKLTVYPGNMERDQYLLMPQEWSLVEYLLGDLYWRSWDAGEDSATLELIRESAGTLHLKIRNQSDELLAAMTQYFSELSSIRGEPEPSHAPSGEKAAGE